MTATMSKATLESTLEGLIRLHFAQQTLGLSQTKADVATDYWKRGIREGIAAILFRQRGDCLPLLKTIPMVYESEVHAIMRDHETDYVHGTPSDKADAIEEIVLKFVKHAVPEELKEEHERLRRSYVLGGVEKAKPEDTEWLTKIISERLAEARAIEALLQPIGWEKVNDVPQTKHPRTEPQCAGMCGQRLSAFDTQGDYANHLRRAHDISITEAGRFAVAGWSRLTTYQQAQARVERTEHPLITASGSGIISTSPTLGDAMADVIGAVRAVEPKTEFFISSGEPPREIREAHRTPGYGVKPSDPPSPT